MQKIKKNDMVKIITGKDKGRTGKVLRVDKKTGRVLVEGCNMVTKHSKPGPGNPNGGIIQKEASLDISNVMLLVDGKPTRVGFKFLEEDKKGENEKKKSRTKVRVARATGKVID